MIFDANMFQAATQISNVMILGVAGWVIGRTLKMSKDIKKIKEILEDKGRN